MSKTERCDNLIGKVFGRLTVVSRAPNTRQKKASWNTLCTCGNHKTVTAANLKKGGTTSCGCYAREQSQQRIERKYAARQLGSAASTELFGRYRRTAKNYNREFTLTKDQFLRLVLSNCHYCGVSPSAEVYTGGKSCYNDGFKFNGIDRKDNQKGYSWDNSVPCCPTCNYGKHTLSYKQYLEYLQNLIKFRTNL